MEEQELKKLISKYNSGVATAEEKILVENWYEELNGEELSISHDRLMAIKQDTYTNLLSHIGSTQPQKYPAQNNKNVFPLYLKWVAAVLLLSITITFYYYNRRASTETTNYIAKNDIAPGGNKAILTLANGSKVVLDDKKNGRLATQGQTIIQKKGSGLLTYLSSALSGQKATEITYNTVSTPRGGQYEVILPDGTQVWLNAASSLKFPTAFIGKERNVELTGEAYFEVSKNKAMPFHVSAAGQVIEVLGTHFNVNAYTDETLLKTTLLEGSVKVNKGISFATLKPGQQSTINNNEITPVIKIAEVTDADEVMAWKDGKFYFNNADIKTVMRQIGRWYDVDIEYAGKIPGNDAFTGAFSRNMTASKALKILAFSGVDFKIEGRKIIVK